MKLNLTIVFIISFIFFAENSFAQKIDSTKLNKWTPSIVTGLNLSQISLSNWTQGGENSISWSVAGNVGYNYLSDTWNYKNSLKLAYGRTKLGSEDFKTNDNEIYLENVLSKNIGWAVNPFFSNSLRTSLTKGYDYDSTPFTEIANFFDPGYLTQSLGFTYDKFSGLKTRLGVAIQEIITSNNTQYADDASTPEIESTRVDTGIESVTSANYNLAENLIYKGELRLFSKFEQLDIWDVRWDNVFVAKINSFMNVNFNVLIVYQQDQSLKAQIKQALQIGLVYTIL